MFTTGQSPKAMRQNQHCFFSTDLSTSQPLGSPLPEDEHACSVSLPTWSSVVGYEEGDPAIARALRTGYPRFVYHPYTVQLMNAVVDKYGTEKEDCLILPSAAAAARCQAFLQRALEHDLTGPDNALIETNILTDASSNHSNNKSTNPGSRNNSNNSNTASRIRRVSLGDCRDAVHAVIFPATTLAGTEAKAYWQHTGEVVSSRRAEVALRKLGLDVSPVCDGPTAVRYCSFAQQAHSPHDALRQRIATWAQVEDDAHVFLAPSGMAAIYTALRSSRRYQMPGDGGTSIVYGFPYLDTLKLCSRPELCPGGVEFFGKGDAVDLKNLELLLKQGSTKVAALFTEVPSNPLLQCPDLYRLRELADEYNFCLVVDDTISNFLNVDIIQTGLADAVCTSLTKLVSGRGDAIAGSVVTNPNTEKGRWMQQDLIKHAGDGTGGLYCQDAHAILENSTDFVERNDVINSNTEALADWLKEQPDVATVYYPKHSAPFYKKVMRPNAGYGGLMSIILHPNMCQRNFYDALDVPKGPSLGTNFTLVCPYTLLAHYHELDFAMQYNVPPNLLRIAVGLEPIDQLKDKFASALRSSRLYPKVSSMQSQTQNRSFSTVAARGSRRGGLHMSFRQLTRFVR